MKATEKATGIEALLTAITGRNRADSIKNEVCNWCDKPVVEFKDAISAKEYAISGMCQTCQDKTFRG